MGVKGNDQQHTRKENSINYEISLSDIIIAEYTALRNEIDIYHEHQRELINYSLILLAGAFGSILPLLTSRNSQGVAFVILLISPLVSLLGLIYTDRTIRILRIAHYIHNYLRGEAISLTKQKVWQWELYKRHASPFRKEVTLILDRVRWMVFVLPSIISVTLFLSIRTPNYWTLLERALFWVAIISPLIMIGAAFLVEETSGVESGSIKNLDEYDPM